MGELYPLLGQQQLDSSEMEDPKPPQKRGLNSNTKGGINVFSGVLLQGGNRGKKKLRAPNSHAC